MNMNMIAMFPLFLGLRGWQLIIVLLLIVLLFGAKRIPDMMKSVGKGIHSFKQGMAEAEAEIKKPVRTDDSDGKKEESKEDNKATE